MKLMVTGTEGLKRAMEMYGDLPEGRVFVRGFRNIYQDTGRTECLYPEDCTARKVCESVPFTRNVPLVGYKTSISAVYDARDNLGIQRTRYSSGEIETVNRGMIVLVPDVFERNWLHVKFPF